MAGRMISTRDINRAIRGQIKRNKPVRILDLGGQDSIAVGIRSEAKIFVEGYAGDYFAAMNDGGIITLKPEQGGKTAGRYVGDTMFSGGIVVQGGVEDLCGHCLKGGIIIIHGDTGNDLGARCSGGVIIVDGNAGNGTGAFMRGGDIIITGGCGMNTGQYMEGGDIYVRGEIGSLGTNAKLRDIDDEDIKKLDAYIKHYDIKVEADEFSKVCGRKRGD